MLRSRPAEAADFVRVAPCLVPLYAGEPALESALPALWARLLDAGAMIGGIVERVSPGGEARPVAFGASVFLDALTVAPFATGGRSGFAAAVARTPELAFDARRIDAAQAEDVLEMVILHSAYPDDPPGRELGSPARLEHYEALSSLLMQETRGLKLRRIHAEVFGPGMLAVFESSGFRPIAAHRDRTPSPARPVFMSVSREEALARPGMRIGTVFAYAPPRFGLRPVHREIVRAALQGKGDEAIAAALDISLSAVKHRWLSLYRFLDDHADALPGLPRSDLFEGGRGHERRRHVLAHFRAHPEDLRG